MSARYIILQVHWRENILGLNKWLNLVSFLSSTSFSISAVVSLHSTKPVSPNDVTKFNSVLNTRTCHSLLYSELRPDQVLRTRVHKTKTRLFVDKETLFQKQLRTTERETENVSNPRTEAAPWNGKESAGSQGKQYSLHLEEVRKYRGSLWLQLLFSYRPCYCVGLLCVPLNSFKVHFPFFSDVPSCHVCYRTNRTLC